MRNILLVVGVAGAIGVFSACGGGTDHSNVPPDVTGTGGTRASGGTKNTAGKTSVDSGGAPSEGGAPDVLNDPRAPTLEITSPIAVDDPNQEGVLTDTQVTVDCQVTQSELPGSSKVNASSVKLAILDAKGTVLDEKAGAPSGTADEYEANFSLATVAAGAISVRCSAEDTAKHASQVELGTFLDKGPEISFAKPEAASIHSVSQPLDIEFSVLAAPLSDTDDKADVGDVTLSIAGTPIDLNGASDKPGHYRLQVNLADATLFNPTPNGSVPIVVEATNKRMVKASSAESVSIDGAGPTIVINAPGDKAVVGGTVKLTITVTDAVAGVDPASVVVSLNAVDYPYSPNNDSWTKNGDAYTFSFDSRQVKDAKVQITVNVAASDKVGNASTGASELMYLDNYPPLLDLDPTNIRTQSINAGSKCSISFDPVGAASKNDLDTAARAGTFRAVVFDQTNSDPEIPVSHGSHTNEGSVRLYLQGDPTTALLVDKNQDGVCDELAVASSTASLTLTALPRAEGPQFGKDDDVAPTASALGCTTDVANVRDHLCTNKISDMWQVIDDIVNKTPVIYAASPSQGLECTGVAWEFGSKLSENGWVCFAARAVDNAGNVGISRPLRVCVNDPDRPTPACANSSIDPPSCTDGCTPPPRWGSVLIPQ